MLKFSEIFCDDDLLKALGSIAAESAYLEWHVEHGVHLLADLNKKAQEALVNKHLFNSKLQMLRQLGMVSLVRRPALQVEFKAVLKKIENANESRNKALHGIWFYAIPMDQTIAEFMSSRRRPVAQKHSPSHGKLQIAMTYRDALKATDKIAEASFELSGFYDRAWPRIFRKRTPRKAA